jgi:hypothetical protein
MRPAASPNTPSGVSTLGSGGVAMAGVCASLARFTRPAAVVVLVLLLGGTSGCGSAQPPATTANTVAVPGVVGLTLDVAIDAVEGAGLRVEQREAPAADVPVGSVVAQVPEEGALVALGSVVLLSVSVAVPGSQSPGLVPVPEVRGLTKADATAALEAAGLVGVSKTVPPGRARVGEVVGQDPAPGTELAPGSAVALEVAGKEAAAANPIAWVLGLGPTAPEGPPEFRAYAMLLEPATCPDLAAALEAGDLAGLSRPAIRLYRATADACLAAFHGKESLWARAQKTLASLAKPTSCIDLSAYRLLQRMVAKHRENPAGTFRLTRSSRFKAPPCPGNAKVEPRSGPMGTAVTVTADDLPRVEDVRVLFLRDGFLEEGGEPALERTSSAINLTVDDPAPAAWACIVLEAAAGWDAAGAWFAIDPSDPATEPQVDCPPKPQQ